MGTAPAVGGCQWPDPDLRERGREYLAPAAAEWNASAPVTRTDELGLDAAGSMLDRNRLLVLRGLVSPSRHYDLRAAAIQGSARRVSATESQRDSWVQYDIEPHSLVWNSLMATPATELVPAALKRPIGQVECWSNLYAAGERIGWHKDRDGGVQLVLCLERALEGGILVVRISGRQIACDLLPGDAVLFYATELPHATTRIIRGRRITAVMRFY